MHRYHTLTIVILVLLVILLVLLVVAGIQVRKNMYNNILLIAIMLLIFLCIGLCLIGAYLSRRKHEKLDYACYYSKICPAKPCKSKCDN